RAGSFGLQPVDQAQTELPGRVEMLPPFLRRDTAQHAVVIFVLLPDGDGDVAGIRSLLKVPAAEHPAKTPRTGEIPVRTDRAAEVVVPFPEEVRHRQLPPLPPAVVVAGTIDDVLFSGTMLEGEDVRVSHLVERI